MTAKREAAGFGASPSAADLALFGNLFASVPEEMGVALARTAYSPNIKERRDFSCALFDGEGRLLAQAAHIPVHLGALPACVRAIQHAFPALRRGDVVIVNDPFAGGTHLPDITLLTPCFARGKKGRPDACLVTRAHHADVGGARPGSLPLASQVYEEGLRIPPVKLYDAGRPNQALLSVVEANVRTPEERRGDLRAQLGAHDTGTRRWDELRAKYGAAALARQGEGLLAYGQRLMAEFVRSIPDGTYRFQDVLDDDGLGRRRLRIRVGVTVRGRRVCVDFAGTDPACAGSLNAVEAVTRSAVYYVFLALLTTASQGRHAPPLNEGCFSPIRVLAPPGSLVNARPPSAVGGGNVETSQRIVDVVFGALAKALPGLVPAASQGTMNNLTLGGTDPRRGEPFAYYETIGGGMGGRPGSDGLSGVQVHMTNTMNTPVEALEYSCPVQVERYELRTGSGGAGQHRGGDGLRRDLRMLAEAQVTLLTERRDSAPYGLGGGEQGRPGENRLQRGGKSRRVDAKAKLDLQPGDVLSIRTPGGGGWGKPRR